MKQLLEKYRGLWRRMRLVHFVFNLLNYKKLAKNRKLYQQAKVSKSILKSIRNEDFTATTNKQASPWLDASDAKEKLIHATYFNQLPEEYKQHIINWIDQGYIQLNNYFEETLIDTINGDIETIINEKKLPFQYGNPRIMNGFKHSKAISHLITD